MLRAKIDEILTAHNSLPVWLTMRAEYRLKPRILAFRSRRTSPPVSRKVGYEVEVEWPGTPHPSPCPPERQAEYQKYSGQTVELFRRVSRGE